MIWFEGLSIQDTGFGFLITYSLLLPSPVNKNARALRVQSPNDAFVSPLTRLQHPHYVAYRKSPRGPHEAQGFLPRHDTYSPLLASSIGALLHRPIVPARLLCFRAVPEEGAPTAVRADLATLLSSQAGPTILIGFFLLIEASRW